jgi:hypothetical protein
MTEAIPTTDQPGASSGPEITIYIDRAQFRLEISSLTGSQLRQLPTPALNPDFDLYEEVPGERDLIIRSDEPVPLRDGQHFFTVPAAILAGSSCLVSRARRFRR